MGVMRNFIEKYKLKLSGSVHVGVPLQVEVDDYLRFNVRVAWVEANPDFYPFLDGLAKKHGHLVVKAGAGDKECSLPFNVASNNQSSSFLSLGRHTLLYPEITYTKTIIVPVKRLDGLFVNKTPAWDFLYMDVQGYEGQVLLGCEIGLDQKASGKVLHSCPFVIILTDSHKLEDKARFMISINLGCNSGSPPMIDKALTLATLEKSAKSLFISSTGTK